MKYISLFMGILLLASGCASYKKNFKSRSVANIGFFADSTLVMLSNIDLTFAREDTLLVRRFINPDAPEEQAAAELTQGLKKSLEDIVKYSIEIVNIAETSASETNRVEAYADYLVELREGLLQLDDISPERFDNTIDEIMLQTEFVEALRKAQPLLNAAVMEIAVKVDDLILSMEKLSEKIDARIEERYADIIRYRSQLEREKFDILTAFEIIYDAYRTDNPELGKLKESGVIWTPEIIPEERPTREDLHAIGEHLQSRMNALHLVQEEIKPDWDEYRATHEELDHITDRTILSAQQSRIILITWVRAHQKMASGSTDPAKWFDVGEITKSLIKSAPSAIF